MPHSRSEKVERGTVSRAPEAMCTFYLRVRPERIALFRFLLEGYDGLAVLSTMDAKDGLVRLIVPASRYTELWDLLFAICEDLCQVDN
ncbi:MAG: DUF4911 domain-containing protein [Candidatus Electrothrix sp. GW3-4]|uniref:DUF4911 domain-containing protein n=1 Tax=Candidatus Electrothrix sp. GW3-4 TaxID=3126740 RepID=UPI0030CE46C3